MTPEEQHPRLNTDLRMSYYYSHRKEKNETNL